MAEQQQAPPALEEEALESATFPPPPWWFKLYAGAPPADEAGAGGGDAAEPAAAAAAGAFPLPPPPPPPGSSLQLFDRQLATDEPLVSTTPNHMIARRLDGSIDVKGQLLSLSAELLPLFLELLRQLVDNPSEQATQLSAINDALDAMQHLSNMLRPQQAVATLEHALRQEAEELTDTLARVRSQREEVDRMLLQAADELAEATKQSHAQRHGQTEGMAVD